MGSIAFLYPGQGSQKVGMGSELAQVAPDLFEHYLARTDAAAGEPITRYCLHGPLEQLSQTHIAQPAILAYSLALTAYAERLGLRPQMVAGHSLGEYSAAVVAGTLSFAEGLRLVVQRGALMYQAQQNKAGAMAAILGLPVEKLQALCNAISEHALVMVTNWNAPTQFVISGVEAGVQQLIAEVNTRKGARAIRLTAKGAFHSPLMAPVQAAIRTAMEDLAWHDAHIPLVANVSSAVLTSAEQIRQELIEQITSPVRWVACVETLVNAGCDTFIELGPGQVLGKLVRLIAPQARVFSLDTPMKIASYVQSVQKVHAFADQDTSVSLTT